MSVSLIFVFFYPRINEVIIIATIVVFIIIIIIVIIIIMRSKIRSEPSHKLKKR